MSIKYAFPILLLLIAANFAAFTLHIWYLLPSPNDTTVNVGSIDKKNGHLRDTSTSSKKEAALQRRDVKKQQIASRSNNKNDEPIRYDVVSSLLQSSYGRVHQLLSIPPKRRMVAGTYNDYTIPPDAVSNLTYFLESRLRDDEEERPLYLYNPALLPLTSNMDVGASYIATYRVSNLGNCHGSGRGVPDTFRNYLGVALLDHELNIVKDGKNVSYEAVIDLNAQLWKKRNKVPQYLQDCQIYTAPTNNGMNEGDMLLLQCNEFAMPIKLQVIHTTDEKQSNTGTQEIVLQNTYGTTKLQLTVLQKPNMIKSNGKNMHYFGPGYMEIWPSGPHEFLHIMDFSKYQYVKSSIMKSPGIEPEPSFATPESNLIDRDRGSACCVSIQWSSRENGGDETTRQLLLGFSHRKTKKGSKKEGTNKNSYNYVSRVYAFEPTPPFNIVARSGLFCLGFANAGAEATDSENEQLHGSANEYKLTIEEQVYDCPRIHFITGITEKIDDKETVIVSYGVNDCYPRMMEVKKEFLIDLLKGSF